MPRTRPRRQAQDEGGAPIGAPPTARIIASTTVTLGRHDRRPPGKETPSTPPPPTAPGRSRDRARYILPEWISERTGQVPGSIVRVDVLDTGQVVYTPLPGQDATRLAWEAARLLRIHQAQARQEWAIQMSLNNRVPYREIGRSARKQRRRIEARRGIPRDYPHGPAGPAAHTA